jgi:signal transduction histidine kinase
VKGKVADARGLICEELIGCTASEIFADAPAAAQAIAGALRGETSSMVLSWQGLVHDAVVGPAYNDQGKITGATLMGIRVSSRAAFEKALSESEARYHSVLSALSEGVVVQDTSGRVIECNPSAERILELRHDQRFCEDPLEPQWSAIRSDGSPFPRDEYPWRVTLRTGIAQRNILMGICRPEQALKWISVNIQPGNSILSTVVSSFSDVTEQREAAQEASFHRDRLTHMIRVKTVGKLAAGIAHELNQPLTAIAALAFTAHEQLGKSDFAGAAHLGELLSKIEAQSIRAGEIILRLRQLIRRSDPRRLPCDLNSLITQVIQLMSADIREAEIDLRLQLEETLCQTILVDSIQIQQVLLNLLKNAIDALKASPAKQRRVTIATKTIDCREVVIEVGDTGPGLSPDLESCLFEPFRTSKEDGLGLGLCISRSIAEAHGGRLWMEPRPTGTTFLFSLPISGPKG